MSDQGNPCGGFQWHAFSRILLKPRMGMPWGYRQSARGGSGRVRLRSKRLASLERPIPLPAARGRPPGRHRKVQRHRFAEGTSLPSVLSARARSAATSPVSYSVSSRFPRTAWRRGGRANFLSTSGADVDVRHSRVAGNSGAAWASQGRTRQPFLLSAIEIGAASGGLQSP